MRRAHSGIAYIAARAQVPVLPVGIYGSTEDMLARALRLERPLLEMRIGQPFYLPAITGRGKARRQSRQQNADLVMNNIARLLPESYHGVYSGAAPLS
jgi:1-acyl-sn-glycerol-3-phosphate acyltransferase